MVKDTIKRVKPKHGFAHFFHLGLVAIVPAIAFIFVLLDFELIAFAIVLLSKWRMFAVRPRHWVAHVRTNAVDIIVSLSLVMFMVASENILMQLIWLIVFEAWVLYIKPGTSTLLISVQALMAQFVGLTAVFLAYKTAPSAIYVVFAAIIGYFCARHFFGAFEEEHRIQYSWYWCFFSASLVWIMSHWLLFYGNVAQPAVLLSVIGYGLAGLYYLHEHDKLTLMVRRQIIFVVIALVFVMIAFSNWGDGIIR